MTAKTPFSRGLRSAHAGSTLARFDMFSPVARSAPALTFLCAVLVLGVFVVDLTTPLGVAVWVFYLVPVGASALGTSRRLPLALAGVTAALIAVGYAASPAGSFTVVTAQLNRFMGAVTLAGVGALVTRLVSAKVDVMERDWVRAGLARVRDRLDATRAPAEIADEVLTALTAYVDAPASALWLIDEDGAARRAAHRGLSGEALARAALKPGEGLVGSAARGAELSEVRDAPSGYIDVVSGVGGHHPTSVLLAPARAEGQCEAVVELGFFKALDEPTRELLRAVAEPVAVALRGSRQRAKLQALLEETQQQAEELQAQQEELRVANEELESQSQALREAQAELEATNAELEQQALSLEERNRALAAAEGDAAARAGALAQASRYKSEFLANMSHELRTPLNSSLILARLLADNRDGNLTDEQVRFARTIYDAGNDLLTLINDILDLSKIEAGKMDVRAEHVSLARLTRSLHETFEPLARQKGVALALTVEPSAGEALDTDSVRLQQVLKNLLSNAVKFTDAGSVTLAVTGEGSEVRFAVRDTGVGIPPEQVDAMFEAFRQGEGGSARRHGGTGLGLTISRDLARLLGGDIEVTSAPGAGSTFTLRVPRALPAQPASAPRPVAPAPAPSPRPAVKAARPSPAAESEGRRRLLVVEDDPAFAGVVAQLARERGFDPVVVGGADEAMASIRERVPAAVVLDLGLPDHTGLAVLDRVKHDPATRHVPVHVVTAQEGMESVREMGAVGYLRKPVEPEALASALRDIEARISDRVRRVLVVEDDATQAEAVQRLLGSDTVRSDVAPTGARALELLRGTTYDCVVMDLALPDTTGFELLERMIDEESPFPPVIVYTGRSLDAAEEARLRRYSESIIVKGARSPERLLEEVTLFLHQVEAELPKDRQRMLREARSREEVFEGKKILLVEDDVRNVFALSSVLERKGARLVIARDGRQALDALEREPVDLVLMDIMMPEMDGLEATRRLRADARFAKLPVIALTAKAMADDREECRRAGANDYLAKPIDADKLLSLVRVWMPR